MRSRVSWKRGRIRVAFSDHAGKLEPGRRGLRSGTFPHEVVEYLLKARDCLVLVHLSPGHPSFDPANPHPIERVDQAWGELVEHREDLAKVLAVSQLRIGKSERMKGREEGISVEVRVQERQGLPEREDRAFAVELLQ